MAQNIKDSHNFCVLIQNAQYFGKSIWTMEGHGHIFQQNKAKEFYFLKKSCHQIVSHKVRQINSCHKK